MRVMYGARTWAGPLAIVSHVVAPSSLGATAYMRVGADGRVRGAASRGPVS